MVQVSDVSVAVDLMIDSLIFGQIVYRVKNIKGRMYLVTMLRCGTRGSLGGE